MWPRYAYYSLYLLFPCLAQLLYSLLLGSNKMSISKEPVLFECLYCLTTSNLLCWNRHFLGYTNDKSFLLLNYFWGRFDLYIHVGDAWPRENSRIHTKDFYLNKVKSLLLLSECGATCGRMCPHRRCRIKQNIIIYKWSKLSYVQVSEWKNEKLTFYHL